jgi:hypothetical protein
VLALAVQDHNRVTRQAAKDAAELANADVSHAALTATQRAMARYPHLRPLDDSESAYAAWSAAHRGGDPDGDYYLDMCDLMAGVPSDGAAENDIGRDGPSGGTPVDLAPTPVADPVPASMRATPIDTLNLRLVPAPRGRGPRRPKPVAILAARAFIEWCVANNRTGAYTASDLSLLYSEHCADQGVGELAHETFKHALKTLPGAGQFQDCQHDPSSLNRGGRHRTNVWQISVPASEDGSAPWVDLPNRKRAA